MVAMRQFDVRYPLARASAIADASDLNRILLVSRERATYTLTHERWGTGEYQGFCAGGECRLGGRRCQRGWARGHYHE